MTHTRELPTFGGGVVEALRRRRSVRAFKPDTVPLSIVRAILEAAATSPSGGNLQPWRTYVLAGRPLAGLVEAVARRVQAGETEQSSFEIYPEGLWEPYRSRRFRCGEDLYATIGIDRSDTPGRLRQVARNFRFFDAPVGMIFCIDRRLGAPQWTDLGIFLQSVMLLATEQGLATCPQAAWSLWPDTLRARLEMPDELIPVVGMALGYEDSGAPINALRTQREPPQGFAAFLGFDGE
jgi:nitroreductase